MTPHDPPPHDDPISRLARDLPEDAPSANWRAGLDAGVRRIHRRRRAVRAIANVAPMIAALAVVGSVLRTPSPEPVKATPGLGSAMVAKHIEIAASPAVMDETGGGEIAGDDFDLDYGL